MLAGEHERVPDIAASEGVSVQKKTKLRAYALLINLGVLAFALEAKADCKYWSEWAYDTKCGDTGVQASITNFVGSTYSVICSLGPNNCSEQKNGSVDFEWWPLSTCQQNGLRVELNYLSLNGQTGDYTTGAASDNLGPDSCGVRHYGEQVDLPSYYVLIACRIGFDCS